ncbi:zinc finger and BTB domain-containing protein 41 [Colius striatus]|uniref:zinc finger and BTB domain-containing protein 41 n=1 Tax=Colius striatus TaxID=57412 RepID=UPI000529B5E0|nr:zinc finger and BTB domain-containing protein 41 [Colius striatus]
MKKRRRLAANLNKKVHLGHEKESSSEQILVVDCAQEIVPKSAESTPVDQLDSSQELSPSSEQRKLLSSLQYNKNLLKYLNDDRQKRPSFCDLLIIVEGKEFSAHKVVVAVGSSYFHACLSKNPSTDVVTLDHVTHSVFQHLLEFLYTSEFFVYKNEIPLVLEAAKFLDIIDAVKLLNNENVSNVQADVVTDAPTPVETLSELTGKLLNNHQCTFCGRNFCYKKSLENHLAKAHRSLSLESKHGLKMVEKANFSARRSTRNRKCPAKFENSDNESGDASDSNLEKVSSDKETSDRSEFEDSESECNADEEGQEEEMSGEEGSESEEQSEKEQNDTEEGSEAVDAVGSIPEGLAPVIIQTSSKKLLQCPKCDKKFDRIGKYESHTRVHTGEKPFECDICHQRYSTKSNLTVHRKKHSSDTDFHKKEHKCPYCNKLHASKKTLAKHVKRFHPENVQEFLSIKKTKSEGWKCDICKKSFTRRPHLEEHMILHSQDKPFKCTYCEEHFKSRFARLKHQEKFHLGPFPCDICGRQFNDTGNLKRHIECTHGGKRKWTCFICGKSVRERTTLKEHLRIHSGEKPHLCSICGQSFRHGSSYRLHLRVHHDDKRYECEECGKTFIRHDHLTKHKKIHSGEKAHQCEECGKCFGRRDHLTVHYKSVHLGEKVWQKYKATFHQCEVCKKVFKGKSSLEMHFRTHSGEKPYKCQICNQSFRIKKTLTKHMVIHSDARPFNCQHCNATFKRKDKLKYHIDHVHGSKAAEEALTSSSEEKLVSLPVQYTSDDKVYQTEAKQYMEQSKVYQSEAKALLQNVSPEVCVPVTLVPVQISDPQADLVQHTTQSHGILPPQPEQTDYQRATDLSFLEKYTLTPQPANIVHPVRPEQMLDPRDQSYLGTLLGLDTAPSVQNISNNEHS